MKKGTQLVSARPGLSLLEVLAALAIFVLTMGVLVHMVNQANQRALEVQEQGQAAQLCRAKLAEISVGALPLTSQSQVPLDEDPGWVWSLDCEQMTEIEGLWRVTVKVGRPRTDDFEPASVTLSQMVLDPSLRGSAFDNSSTTSSTTDTTSSGGTSSTSGSTSGSTTQPSSGGSSTPQTPPRGTTSTPSTPPRGGSR